MNKTLLVVKITQTDVRRFTSSREIEIKQVKKSKEHRKKHIRNNIRHTEIKKPSSQNESRKKGLNIKKSFKYDP